MKGLHVLSSIGLLSLILVLSHCADNPGSTSRQTAISDAVLVTAVPVLAQNCISCHAAAPGQAIAIAPSLQQIKAAYLKPGIGQTEFLSDMTRFLLAPSQQEARMPDAVAQYGLMPNLGMSKEQYDAVAAYLFSSDLEAPDWYTEQFARDQQQVLATAAQQPIDYLSKGMEIAQATKAVLGKNLLNAIQARGTEGALAFCNERAIPLTDSMAMALHASVRRVSDRPRNPQNQADSAALAYIQNAKSEIAASGKAKPLLLEIGDQKVGYYPITTNDMCLQCHGQAKTQISDATLEKIHEFYPADQAVGYASEELRGIWVVEMK